MIINEFSNDNAACSPKHRINRVRSLLLRSEDVPFSNLHEVAFLN